MRLISWSLIVVKLISWSLIVVRLISWPLIVVRLISWSLIVVIVRIFFTVPVVPINKMFVSLNKFVSF